VQCICTWDSHLVALDNHCNLKIFPLYSTVIYPKSGLFLLYSTIDRWNEMPYKYTFALRISFHLLQCRCNTCTNQSQMIWSTSYHHMTVLVYRSWLHLLFTVTSVHRRQVITQLALHTYNRSIKPSLVLIFSTLVTWLNVMSHMQWAPSSHVWVLQHLKSSSPSSWHRLLTQVCLWTNYLCISYLNILVHLDYHLITKTKQWPFTILSHGL
jgi:hypothetical protein